MYKSQKITVIIPCLNEEQGIEQVLRRTPNFVDQVIVVDNGSVPAFDPNLVEGLAGNFRLLRIDQASPSPASAVNVGLAAAEGNVICVMIDGSGGTASCSGKYENVSAAFGGAPSMTVLQMLTFENNVSNSGGAIWYSQVKATQDLEHQVQAHQLRRMERGKSKLQLSAISGRWTHAQAGRRA